jgi:hypothetical protein
MPLRLRTPRRCQRNRPHRLAPGTGRGFGRCGSGCHLRPPALRHLIWGMWGRHTRFSPRCRSRRPRSKFLPYENAGNSVLDWVCQVRPGKPFLSLRPCPSGFGSIYEASLLRGDRVGWFAYFDAGHYQRGWDDSVALRSAEFAARLLHGHRLGGERAWRNQRPLRPIFFYFRRSRHAYKLENRTIILGRFVFKAWVEILLN